ncbi:YebC/PmpR family DNA-binding transcriptional regulator [bacterium]|nr:YebC/PmpR family DNA-binding transcriptional regulator [bacterium]
MSGHSKWAGIKHKKAVIDAKRGKLFTKIIKEINIAARQGGGDMASNARLRTAVEKAKAGNMPQDNIKKAIQRGTGELPGITYEEFLYEGYGPGGVAVLVEITTDNKNRTSSEIKRIFSKRNGNLGESGCVAWMFSAKGYFVIDKINIKEDELMSLALEYGAEDFCADDKDVFEIITTPADFEKMKEILTGKKIEISSCEITRQAHTQISLEGKEAQQMTALIDDLEENDDVQNVYTNFDMSEQEM